MDPNVQSNSATTLRPVIDRLRDVRSISQLREKAKGFGQNIATELSNRSPLIGLGIKFIQQLSKTAREESEAKKRLDLADSLAYRDLLDREKTVIGKISKEKADPKTKRVRKPRAKRAPKAKKQVAETNQGLPRFAGNDDIIDVDYEDLGGSEYAGRQYHQPAPRLLASHEMNARGGNQQNSNSIVPRVLPSENKTFNMPAAPMPLLGGPRSLQFRNRDEKGRYAPGYVEGNHVPANQNGVHTDAKGFGPNLAFKIVEILSSIDQNIVKFHKEDTSTNDQKENAAEENRLELSSRQDELVRLLVANRVEKKEPQQQRLLTSGAVKKPTSLLGSVAKGGANLIKGTALLKLATGLGTSVIPTAAKTIAGVGTSAVAGAGSTVASTAAKALPGVAGAGSGVLKMLGGSLLALAIDGVLGAFKSQEWGVSKSSGAIAGMLGGSINNTMINGFSQMGKWALIGATAGSVFPGLGTLAGGILGAAFGGIMGAIGGEKISGFIEKTGIGEYVSSFVTMVGNLIAGPVRIVWKSIELGFRLIKDTFELIHTEAIEPLTPIMEPMYDASKKFFGFFTKIFNWISDFVGSGNKVDQALDGLINAKGNVMEQILTSFHKSMLDMAASMLEKASGVLPFGLGGKLKDAANGFRKQSEDISTKQAQKKAEPQPTPVPPTKVKEPETPLEPHTISVSDSDTSQAPNPANSPKSAFNIFATPSAALPAPQKKEEKKPEPAPIPQQLSPPGKMDLSSDGLKQLTKEEGFSSKEYWDHKGYSIGYGHLQTEEEREKYKGKISKEDAQELLKKDVQARVLAVNKEVKIPISQKMFDSLVDFTYNAGEGSLQKVASVLNTGDFAGAAALMKRYDKAKTKKGTLEVLKVLTKRRETEANAFLSGLPQMAQNTSDNPALKPERPTQGRNIMEMRREIADSKAEASGKSGGNNVVVAPSRTEINNTAVISQQHDPRNTDSTFRDTRSRNYYGV
jgi:GH24 family phage-related lysozyme (muramidase)